MATHEEVRSIAEAGYLEMFIDLKAGVELVEACVVPGAEPLGKMVMSEELARAREIYAGALLTARKLFIAVSKGLPMDMEAAIGAVDALNGSLERNPAALNCLGRFSHTDSYLYSHSVNVSVLSMCVSRAWGQSNKEIREIGLAGLFHDLGKTSLPVGLLSQSARLTSVEFEIMEGHCVHGLTILEAQGDVSSTVKRAVVEHHERYDGTGYPFNMSGEQISLSGRILSLADCFDALVSRRTYKEPLPPSRALSIMYAMRDKGFASKDVDLFIKVLGVHPTGSLVLLTSGEVAVVCETDPENPMAPMINVILDERLNPLTPRTVNLADLTKEDEDQLRIEKHLDAWSMNLEIIDLLLPSK